MIEVPQKSSHLIIGCIFYTQISIQTPYFTLIFIQSMLHNKVTVAIHTNTYLELGT